MVLVTLEGDQLMAQLPTGGKLLLAAESDTKFSVAGTPLEFKKDARGAVNEFVVHAVEGDQRAMRKADGAPAKTAR
jgi:hypothetical protein